MNVVKPFSRNSLFWIIFFMGITCVLVNFALFTAMDFITIKLSAISKIVNDPAELLFLNELGSVAQKVNQVYLPATIGLFLIFSLLLWICLKFSFSKLIKANDLETSRPETNKIKKPSEQEKKERERSDRRIFLHLFSVLQREGRLMDFFSEDLDEYDDEQIGAAVRNIHDNCKKVMNKYLTAAPVVKQEEDDEILVEQGFDPNEIKLTGNVTGEPPFKGIVRHRGWKAAKLEMPSLSGKKDPDIIAPAEVEIL